MESTSVVVKDENGSSFPGGLQETYTDFDAWISKWNWKFKQRSFSATRSAAPIKKLEFNEIVKRNLILDDLFVYGFAATKMAALKEILFNSEPLQTEDYIHLDYVLIRLLNENSKKNVLFLNSKL